MVPEVRLYVSTDIRTLPVMSLSETQGPRKLGTRRTVITDVEIVFPSSRRERVGVLSLTQVPRPVVTGRQSEGTVECPVLGKLTLRSEGTGHMKPLVVTRCRYCDPKVYLPVRWYK